MNFVPFRDSKLTRLLTESLGGNCKTTICACISPSLLHYDESFSTLLFATRAMSVKTRVVMNEKVEVRYLDENGRPISPRPYGEQHSAFSRNINDSSSMMGSTLNASQNEILLKKQNSQLLM